MVRKSLLAAGENPDLSQVAKLVVSLYTDVSPDHAPTHSSDQVQDYAREILTLGLLWYGFKDAIREGDGDRVMRYWRYFLLLFKACGRKNYSCEAAKLLFSDKTLSPRMQTQLRFSRFVNVHGRQGTNVPLDLHCEHLNRVVKDALINMGSNWTDKSINRAGRSVGVLSNLCQLLQEADSGKQTPPSHARDLQRLLSCLADLKPFECVQGRTTNCVFKTGLLQLQNRPAFIAWLKQQYYLYSIYKL